MAGGERLGGCVKRSTTVAWTVHGQKRMRKRNCCRCRYYGSSLVTMVLRSRCRGMWTAELTKTPQQGHVCRLMMRPRAVMVSPGVTGNRKARPSGVSEASAQTVGAGRGPIPRRSLRSQRRPVSLADWMPWRSVCGGRVRWERERENMMRERRGEAAVF